MLKNVSLTGFDQQEMKIEFWCLVVGMKINGGIGFLVLNRLNEMQL